MSTAPLRVAVAASGGRDSTALMHCTLRAAAPLGVQVVALHVHHGLMPDADDWLDHVRRQSARWGAAFDARRLHGTPPRGVSVEAWARRGRYAALAEMAQTAGCGLVLLAHHRRDQAETWLLQALRSGGPAGLSAMPRLAARAGVVWARPWLDMPREAIECYVRRHRLRHIDDDSNTDPRHARNRLRLQVWPPLLAAFADAEGALASAAARAQEAAALSVEVAALDLPGVSSSDGAGRCLHVPAWRALPPARRRNALQAWLRGALPDGVPHTLLQRLQDELPAARHACWPAGDGELQLYRGVLRWASAGAQAAGRTPLMGATDLRRDPGSRSECLDLSRPGTVALAAWHGRIVVDAVAQGGVMPEVLRDAMARPRSGGERFRPARGAPARSLKKQYQTHAVPAWERNAPLLFTADGRLLFVPGLGVDAALQAAPGQPQLGLRWLPD